MTGTWTTKEYSLQERAEVHQVLYDFIDHYGYVAMYVLLSAGIIGVPVPDETLMTFVGSLTVPGGLFRYTPALLVLYAGTMTGMLVSYFLGKRVGKPFLYRYGKWFKLTPARIERAESWFIRYGLWAVFFGYFVPGIRHFTCYLAGVSGVKLYKYLLFAGTGALLWCTTFLTLGHYIGRNFQELMHLIHTYMGYIAGVIVIVAGLVIYFYMMKKKRKAL
jgi:membrane protein DedA with SNARE-associated domain